MALSANQNIQTKIQPVRAKLKVVDGVIQIFRGALLSYEKGNIGYVELGTDPITVGGEFAGIAMEELDVSAADNAADGTYEIEVMPRGTGEWVKLPVTTTISIANEGDPVYVDGDDAVDIASGITNITGGLVGIIRQFVSANVAWIDLVKSPVL